MKNHKKSLPLLMVGIGIILFSIGDAFFKVLTNIGIYWWDFLVFGVPFEILTIFIIALISKKFDKTLIYIELMPKRFLFPILRGLISILALVSIFISLKELPLSLTTMLIQTTPIWMGIISLFLYNEKPTFLTIFSIFLGIIGIIIIVNPTINFDGISKYMIFPIIVAVINAIMNLIITKRPNDASPMSYAMILFILNGFAGLVIWIYFGYKIPNLYQFTLIALTGFIGAVAFLFVSYGYSIAEGHFARTGVMGYIQLPTAIMLGVFFFNEQPTLIAYFGCTLIIFAGLIVLNSKSN
tara:strand:- start:825 stop:1715 length:891 start_codon:yes stop_codon:yes gene_type:complete